MKLSKQLFAAFLAVAILPLLVVSVYLFGTNISLARKLYEEELQNSTQMQANWLEDHINRMAVRAGNFAQNATVRAVCEASNTDATSATGTKLSSEILKFTDETLDSLTVFALVGRDNTILYSSGSNGDTKQLALELSSLEWGTKQTMTEFSINPENRSLVIVTPVFQNDKRVGGFLAVYRSDFFLKTISSHKQVTPANAFIYCTDHMKAILAKKDMRITPTLPLAQIEGQSQGAFIASINGQRSMCYFRAIPKTPWLLVSSISFRAMLPILEQYFFVGLLVLMLSLCAVFLLSHLQSRRMLRPLDSLLIAVEQFFVSGAQAFPLLPVDPKTEIGYLASKFSGMSQDIVTAQNKLRESTYLYQTLLYATYELRITVFVQENKYACFPVNLSKHLDLAQSADAKERVMYFLQSGTAQTDPSQATLLRDILWGRATEPCDTEVCCTLGSERTNAWFRMLSVPIADAAGSVNRVVLHFEDITENKRKELRLIHSSQVDPLCGLLNKTAFLPRCEQTEKGVHNAMFFIDLDQFKQVNDTLGHAAGDEVLIATANAIRSQFRTSDVLGRYGGDEFVVYAPHMTREQTQERARLLVESIFFSKVTNDGKLLSISASIGVCLTDQSTDLAHALKIADAAMYQAKENGKRQFYILQEDQSEDAASSII